MAGIGKRFRNSCVNRKAKQKNFISLIKNNLGAYNQKTLREFFSFARR
jgi:hypothetical protein